MKSQKLNPAARPYLPSDRPTEKNRNQSENKENAGVKNPDKIDCFMFDFANTLCSQLYFQTRPANCANWRELFDTYIFHDSFWITEWCNGRVTSSDIALEIQKHVALSVDEIVDEMMEGCRNLSFNKAVLDYACRQKVVGRKTALVSLNIDLFSTVVVPAHNLQDIFSVIINSADYGTDDKEYLWKIAFDQLGIGAGYGTALLIDDSVKWVDRFRRNGGAAHHYVDDLSFSQWISLNEFAGK